MAGRSSSSSSSFTYDVYLSFRNSGTRFGFSSYLYKALSDKGILTFIDDLELKLGDNIPASLIEAIDKSRIVIAVLSENYASSSFCLDELAYIIERSKAKGFLVLPVFYDVHPSDVRHQRGPYEEVFAKHEERFKDNREKVQKWRNALQEAANMSGFHFSDGYEREFVEKIVEKVSTMINSMEEVRILRNSPVMLAASQRAQIVWRVVGLASSVVGMLCHALSPSFKHLISGWNDLKLFLYCMFSLIVCAFILFSKQSSILRQQVLLRSCLLFAVLMIISVYSFLYDKAVNGKPEIKSLVANAAFAVMSLGLSKLIKSGYEIGMFAYFLSCFTIQLLTINWKLIWVAIIFGCPLFLMHSYWDSTLDGGNKVHVIHSSSDSQPHVGSASQHVLDVPSEEMELQ